MEMIYDAFLRINKCCRVAVFMPDMLRCSFYLEQTVGGFLTTANYTYTRRC